MTIPEKFNKLTRQQKKQILYKVCEIYSDSDDFLDYINELDNESTEFVWKLFFSAKWENERNTLWEKEYEKYEKLINNIKDLKRLVDMLWLEMEETFQNLENNSDEELDSFLQDN